MSQNPSQDKSLAGVSIIAAETASDVSGIVTSQSRVGLDPANKAIRTWYNVSSTQGAKSPGQFKPRDVAYEFMKAQAKDFMWKGDLADLRDRRVNSNGSAHSVRFTQDYKGVPVDSSEIVVNMNTKGTIYAIYNNYHYSIPQDLDPKKNSINDRQAKDIAEQMVKRRYTKYSIKSQTLIVYQYHRVENGPPKGRPEPEGEQVDIRKTGKILAQNVNATPNDQQGSGEPEEGHYYLAWDFRIETQEPRSSWRILLNAMTGRTIAVIDMAQYAVGSAKVFDPNPVVTSGNPALSPTTASSVLDRYSKIVTLDRLNGKDSSGNLHLDGTYVQMDEIESPVYNEPVSVSGDFAFQTSNRSFLDAMCYYHIDKFQDYIQKVLGLTNVCNYSIKIDPQGCNGGDQSYYIGGAITFGEGGVPDAQDAMVILHEYGHAIQDNVNPGFDDPSSGVGEGFGDFIAAVFYDDKHLVPSATRGWMMSWDARGGWGGRRYDLAYGFDDPRYANEIENHTTGALWASVMFELYRKLGGDSIYSGVKAFARDLAIRLHLMANFLVPASNATATQMAQQIEAADGNLLGWNGLAEKLHYKVIYDTFSRRKLIGYPNLAVDVYINDGRDGGYGSSSKKDLFSETLWQDNYWSTQDIWVRANPYASTAAQGAGGPGDHVEPPINSVAYLYVRVKNRGSDASGSGPVKVRVFHSLPGLGLVWSDDWTEMDASLVSQPSNILSGTDKGVIVGPFTWIPTQLGHECVLAVVECEKDHALTQNLHSPHVEHSQMVPFDNNIAQRNLFPTAAKGKMTRGFYVRNPDTKPNTVVLQYNAHLPRRWGFHINLVNPTEIRLGGLDRRYVELTIDQGSGTEVKDFTQPYTISVTGLIANRLIGGMTFYVAPESAFAPGALSSCKPCFCQSANTPFCFHICSWKENVVQGELDIKVRFEKK
ncbi:hypothetical protein TWF694_005987 [Orbilia ellipsospora]|uniref:Extracellular metalloproteinase n=1 Tax=Orbilia ellipsospora TaxID=2528407 RepID=A0AAV9WRW9_9PEZI